MIRLFSLELPLHAVFLIALDAVILYLAISVGLLLSYDYFPSSFALGGGDFGPKISFIGTIILTSLSVGLYQRRYLVEMPVTLLRLLVGFVLAIPTLASIFYLVPGTRIWLSALAPALALGLAGLFAVRVLANRMAGLGLFRRKVLVVGTGPKAAQIEAVERLRSPAFSCVGFLADGAGGRLVTPERVIDGAGTLSQFVEERGVSEIVLALDPPLPPSPPPALPVPRFCIAEPPTATADRSGLLVADRTAADLGGIASADGKLVVGEPEPLVQQCLPAHLAAELLVCRLRGVQVKDFLSFIESERGEVPLESLHLGWLIFSNVTSIVDIRFQRLAKRLFDIVASIGLLVVTLPITALAALAILAEDRGPVLYRQERIGLNGTVFRLFKFRSMRVDAERDGVARWAALNDPRVTLVGSMIRKTRIDEIPQILNVLRGEMSFVGPRPERPAFVAELGALIPFYDYRHAVKPGITGWAQINYPYGASVEDARRKLQFDLYYIKNQSLLLDLLILIQTVRVILWPAGAR